MERWAKIDFGFFSVSTLGRIRNDKSGHIIKTQITNSGYELVHLNFGCDRKAKTVHRLVALHFLPAVNGRNFVNHIDGNKLNNNLSNLEWVTPGENVKHAISSGLMCHKGVKNGNRKLSNEKILLIREKLSESFTNVQIGKLLGVDPSTISNIKHGKTWGHVAPPGQQTSIALAERDEEVNATIIQKG